MPDSDFKRMVDALDESKDRAAIEAKYMEDYRCFIYSEAGTGKVLSVTDRYGNAVDTVALDLRRRCRHCHALVEVGPGGLWYSNSTATTCHFNSGDGHEPTALGERLPMPGRGMIPAPGSELHYGSITPEVQDLMRQIVELQGRMLGAKILRRAIRHTHMTKAWDLLDEKLMEILSTPRDAEYFTDEWAQRRTDRQAPKLIEGGSK